MKLEAASTKNVPRLQLAINQSPKDKNKPVSGQMKGAASEINISRHHLLSPTTNQKPKTPSRMQKPSIPPKSEASGSGSGIEVDASPDVKALKQMFSVKKQNDGQLHQGKGINNIRQKFEDH